MKVCRDCLHYDACVAMLKAQGYTGDCSNHSAERCDDFKDRISWVERPKAQRWIPVTDRLPDLIPCNAGTAYSEAVIVWTDNRKAMIAVWDGTDFICSASFWNAEGENITHWMPLPEPPKEAECSEQKK